MYKNMVGFNRNLFAVRFRLFSSLGTDIAKKPVDSIPPIAGCPHSVKTGDISSEKTRLETGNIIKLNSVPVNGKNEEKLRDFEDIPGPRSLPLFGTLWKYAPFIGSYSFDYLHRNGMKNYRKYGKIVRETILPSVNLLYLFDPRDIETLFRNEGRYPERRSHLALVKFRKDRADIYNSGGLLPTNGPEWWRLRSNFQKSISSPTKVKAYIEVVDNIVTEFADRVKYVKCDGKKNKRRGDFMNDLSRLSLEIMCVIAFDVRLDSFGPDEIEKGSKTSRLIDAAFVSNSSTLQLDRGFMWRYFDTPLYRKFCRAQDYLEQVAVDLVSQKMSFFGDNTDDSSREPSLLDTYLANSEVDLKDIVGVSVDFLLAAIDTTTYTSSFLLYHMATNPKVQEKLYKESLMLLPKDNDEITPEVLSKAVYTKACLKESLRLNPVSIGVGRIATSDTAISGYHVPKGTVIVTQNYVSCRLSEYFPEPLRFIPERWLKGNSQFTTQSPFLVLPFGHGPRTCIARRLAEQNMQITLLRLIRKFVIGWSGGKLGIKTYLINVPDRPINLTFRYRNN